jgi:predicted nucleotidyltransferase component of viral defense system
MTGPMLAEWEQVASRFGVAMEQVRRDHLISHVLAAISSGVSTDDLVFIGGTALSRTHLADARLSEDIDLIARNARREVAEQIERAVRRGIARSHGRPTWLPTLTATTGSQPAVLSVPDGTSVQVQLLGGDGYS